MCSKKLKFGHDARAGEVQISGVTLKSTGFLFRSGKKIS
jgi:hypothetical protein